MSFCGTCEGRDLDISLLEQPDDLTGRTFWRIWRHYTLIPLRKYLLKGIEDSVEVSIVNQVLDELEIDLLEFRHTVTVKMKRLKTWRKMRESTRKNGRSKQVKDAHEVLGHPLPKRGENPIAEIKKTFKMRARASHPDLADGREEEFKEVKEAYETLLEHYTGG